MQPPRITQHRHEQEHLDLGSASLNQPFAEVDL
jgi:hypothetical protein